MTKKVAVIGPGALGCLFAARFAHCGIRTWLIDYLPERAAMLTKTGITVEGTTTLQREQLTVTTSFPAGLDLIVVLTKAYATGGLALPPDTPVLTLQNGLGNAEKLALMVGSANVLAGATSEAVTWLDVGCVRHVAPGATIFGAWTTCDTDTPMFLLQKAGFDAAVTEAPGSVIWEKAAINAGINPLTALLNVPNGVLLQRQETRQLMRDLVVEATKVAGAEGYRFGHSLVERAEQVCENTRDNISSMLQDVRKGKRTEIEAISGEILRRGQEALLPTPRTRVVYQLVRALERV